MKRLATALLLSLLPLLGWSSPPQQTGTPPQVDEIIVICKTHFDIGYTHRVNEIVQYYRTEMIDRALKAMERSANLPPEQQFAWTLPGWVLAKTMEEWDGQDPARQQILDTKFRNGQIISHAVPFTLISDVCGLEEMVRGLHFSSDLSRKYGLPLSRSGKMTDEPSHTAALATVLAQAGVKFLHVGCNWPSGYVKTPGLFWWEGPDGSRILMLYSPSYGTCYALTPSWQCATDPMLSPNLLPSADWPYKVWPAIIVTGDNSGPPTAEQIQELFADAKKKMPGVNIHMGTMDDFYDALMRYNPDIPVVKSAMPDTWIHGVMCDPGGIRLFRETRAQLPAAEILNTQLNQWGVTTPDASAPIADAYEKMGLYGEHTWGGSSSVNAYGKAFEELPANQYADLEASWEDKTGYVRSAAASTQSVLQNALTGLADNVRSKSASYLVYNPLPWSRSGWVEIDGHCLYADQIPACGYRVIPQKKAKPAREKSGNTIENRYYRIVLDPSSGSITSWVDKRTGREWVDPNAAQGLGQYLNERFTFEQTLNYTMAYQQGRAGGWPHPGMHKPGMISEKEVPYRAATCAGGTLQITEERGIQTAEMTMPGDPSNHLPGSSLRITLYDDQPYVDLEITLRDKPKDNWPEADWLCLPFRIDQPEFQVYRQLGTMNPATEILPGANRHLYAAENGVTITGTDGAGVAVCPIDHPLVSLGTPGCWKYSEDYVPTSPVVYLNLYNNQWNTNFRYWYPGTWSSRVRLWTIDAGTDASERTRSFMTRALEARQPMEAMAIEHGNGNGTLPSTRAGVTLSRPGATVTAFCPDPDGHAGTLLRIWEQAGAGGTVTVTLPEGVEVSTATPVNLRGEKSGEPLTVTDRQFDIELPAYAPASFLLQ